MLSEKLRFHRLNLDYFKTPYIQHCILEMPISDVLSDLTIEVGSANLSLHRFPLVSESGRIRNLLLEAKDTKVSRINVIGLPGGSDAFELAAKFCYGVNIEITISNMELLRYAARFIEMTEDISKKNLDIHTEVFLKDAVFPNISNSISVLHRSETLLPVSEEVNLVSHLTNAISNNTCKEQLTSGVSKLEYNFPSKPIKCADSETPSDYWGKSLAVLNLDFFQRVLLAVTTKVLNKTLSAEF
ncbi:BTB/POZ domain-containing protein SETH6 [Capsicum annuum]|uniref:BTB/POZ domain-containing protein SETH6 n=1 Tax=Capsicum annuum TaxID=4072 RepID=A0A2G3AJH9_CAPAN|nr:BTB/POZ domain-containing protein SETH6 [Capsicum annuum]KAF3667263.1 BTB/POZ domain-containing protein SETH6 [Capsicum annuum]PHT94382.1 BTB/POZ domain-containing protein SETH6 [Capsicum annuum]